MSQGSLTDICLRIRAAEFDHGTVLSLLVAARLYSPVALVNAARWASESGADILWNLPMEKITDDRLGKSLDAFFTQRHSILASLALHVAQEFSVCLSELHYDPTHILLHGAYEEAEPRPELQEGGTVRSNGALPPAHITQGRPMSDAPKDVQMIHAGLCTVVDEWGALPIFGHTVGGNENGHTAVAEQLALLKKHLRPPELTLISDRGTFAAGHLLRLSDAGYSAIAAAPWDDFRPLFDEQWNQLTRSKASYLSLEQQRRRTQGNLPQEHYELAAWANGHQLVSVHFAGQTLSTTANEDGHWEVILSPLEPSATGRDLTVRCEGEQVRVRDVVVGDVWHASGQSNMAMTVAAVAGRLPQAETDIQAAKLPAVRFRRINENESAEPLVDLPVRNGWIVCSPETVPNFSAAAFYFSRMLNAELGVPIGIIDSSRGGTPIEPFIPRESFRSHPTLRRELELSDQGDLRGLWKLPGGVRARDANWLPGRLFHSRLIFHPLRRTCNSATRPRATAGPSSMASRRRMGPTGTLTNFVITPQRRSESSMGSMEPKFRWGTTRLTSPRSMPSSIAPRQSKLEATAASP